MPEYKSTPAAFDTRLPYRLRDAFLSSTELALMRVLNEMMGGRYVVCPKISLNELFYIARPNENVHFFNKIFRKHVDFLLCDHQTMAPAFGVELVRPISKNETRPSDQFVDDLFLSAGLPLVHIPAGERYDPSDIVNLFQLAIAKVGGTTVLRLDVSGDSTPMCPICGKMMVLRIRRDGPKSGKKYYGCMDNPYCAGVVAID
jgi:hypothetical protein